MSLLTNLVSYWPLDGNSLDVHGANNGTDTAVTYGPAHTLDGASGNGTTSLINVGAANLNITGDLTISAWVKVTASNCTGFILTRCVANGGASNTYEFRLSGGTPQFLIYSGQPIASSSLGQIPLNVWTFLTAVREGMTQRIYVDGSLVGTATLTLTPTSLPAQATLIGSRDDNNANLGDEGFSVDEVAIYNRALSSEEVRDLWSTPGGYPLTPVPFTPFFAEAVLDSPPLTFDIPFVDIFAAQVIATAGYCAELDFPSRGSVTEGIFDSAPAQSGRGGSNFNSGIN